jgi:hypothetical protein
MSVPQAAYVELVAKIPRLYAPSELCDVLEEAGLPRT